MSLNNRNTHKTIREIMAIRRDCIDEAEFGEKIAPLVDMLITDWEFASIQSEKESLPRIKKGKWGQDEEDTIIKYYEEYGDYDGCILAAKVLNRSYDATRRKKEKILDYIRPNYKDLPQIVMNYRTHTRDPSRDEKTVHEMRIEGWGLKEIVDELRRRGDMAEL